MIAQNGSDGVMNLVTSGAGNGTIGYTEYSYALNAGYPVAKVGNAAGYFTAPTALNVAKSLTHASIAADLTERLDAVYTYDDPRTYPLSSYSYLVLPTGDAGQDPAMSTAKRQTLADFLGYALCAGQRSIGPLGYGLLPRNLVQAGFDQIQKLKDVDPAVDLSGTSVATCANPTFVAADPNRDYLSEIAPLPPSCDQVGQGPCNVAPPTPPAGTAGVPMQVQDATAPYTGALSLQLLPDTAVDLTQLDPLTSPGHPQQGTDPTGHRHAWVFAGGLGGVSVSDTRPDEPGWTLTGQATDFTNGAITISAKNLGWSPSLAPSGSDAEGPPLAGPAVSPLLQSGSGTGLAAPGVVLASAPAGSGLGTQNVTANLVWWIPDDSPTGTYASTLTLTLISP
jgi:phosphate transport system substrate-binding protein